MDIFEDFIEELREENLLEGGAREVKPAENNAVAQPDKISAPGKTPTEKAPAPNYDAEYFRKKAVNEVSFLQMVEYIVAGIERDQLKTIPQPYNDLEVKKALHAFQKVSNEPHSPEHVKAQFHLLQETENWHSSLSIRDGRVMTAHLRRYLETSRPPLSSAALLSLAKFYRNSSYTDQVRCKFDLVVTRLFSKEISKGKREAVFQRHELSTHLGELYADWSSIPLYSVAPDDRKILRFVAGFEAFIKEAEAAETFDELINKDFFMRLQAFKERANENFFAPVIMATAVESNVRIGNRYVELLEAEKKKGGNQALENKLGITSEQILTNADGKTVALIGMLNQRNSAVPTKEKSAQIPSTSTKTKVDSELKSTSPENKNSPSSDKWLLGGAAIVVALILMIIYLSF